MRCHHLALFLALAGPAALAQTPVNEGPKSVPVPNTPNDAEHAPTSSERDRRLPARKQEVDKDDRTTGYASGAKAKNKPAQDKDERAPTTNDADRRLPAAKHDADKDGRTTGYDPASPVRDRPPQNKDDAEHAPTRKTDEAVDARPAPNR